MIKVIVLDDIPEQVDILVSILRKDERFELAGCFQHPRDALPILHNQEVDLICSDVEMPGLGGFDFIRTLEHKPEVIFVSAYPEYAIQSFEFEPLHFLPKPLEMEAVLQALERAYLRIRERKEQVKPFIFIKSGYSEYHKVDLDTIIMVEGSREYLNVYTTDGKLLTNKRLKEMERELAAPEFLRIHRSYIINTNHIVSINAAEVVMKDDIVVPLGQPYRKELKQKMGLT